MESSVTAGAAEAAIQERLVAFIRAFGLHRPDQTPCGQPVSVSDAHALMELRQGAPMTQHELAARLGLEKSTVSRLVTKLEGKGWIDRRPNPHDGRGRLLHLKPAAIGVADRLALARQEKFSRLMKAIPDDDRLAVLNALEILTTALTQEDTLDGADRDPA